MKRLVLIAAAVLLPFAALVFWGLAALRDEPLPLPLPPPPHVEPLSAPLVAEPAPRKPPPAPAQVPVLVPPPQPPEPPPVDDDAAALAKMEPKEALIHELTPLVHLCFLDMSDRLKQVISVSASFEPRPDGTVTNVRLKIRSGDPYLIACVQDALEGAHLELPQGMPAGAMRHTFTFNPHATK